MTDTFDFRLLGPLAVFRGGEEVQIAMGKQRIVLAALLLHVNQVVQLNYLIEALWGSNPPQSSRVTVQNYVKRLRKA